MGVEKCYLLDKSVFVVAILSTITTPSMIFLKAAYLLDILSLLEFVYNKLTTKFILINTI